MPWLLALALGRRYAKISAGTCSSNSTPEVLAQPPPRPASAANLLRRPVPGPERHHKYSPIAELHYPLMEQVFGLCGALFAAFGAYSPLAVIYSPLVELHSPLAVLYSPFAALYSPFAEICSPLAELHAPLTERVPSRPTEEHREVLEEFPPVFRARLFRHLYRPVIQQSYLLSGATDAFIDTLACELAIELFMPDVTIVSQYDAGLEIYFMVRTPNSRTAYGSSRMDSPSRDPRIAGHGLILTTSNHIITNRSDRIAL